MTRVKMRATLLLADVFSALWAAKAWWAAVTGMWRWTVAGAEGGPKFDHVVSVMFENRSFDNLLGRLYEAGEVASFEGVIGKDLSNPIPPWAEHGAEKRIVPYAVAANMDTPTRMRGRNTRTSTSSCPAWSTRPATRASLPSG
jgi:hypothetical protein